MAVFVQLVVLFLVLGISCIAEASSLGDKKIICYYGSWARYRPGKGRFTPSDINAALCTHVVYSFAKLENNRIHEFDESDISQYQEMVNLKQKNPNLKVMMAIGGWLEGSEKYSQMVSNEGSRNTFVSSVVEFLSQHKFDGLDLDWEYPAARGGKPEDKQNFVSLIRELRGKFNERGWQLTAAVNSAAWVADPGYDIPQLSNLLDAINLMTYDLHGSWEPRTGLNAPFNEVENAVNYWLSKGANPSKLILGMGMYGRSFTLTTGNNGIGAPATAGNPGPFTGEAGILSYYEICENINYNKWTVVQDGNGPYAYSGNQWVGYDDEGSIQKKIDMAKRHNLGGGMIWSLELDDFRGECFGNTFILLKAVYSGFAN